ncbi:MAG TPA: hypothetical protein VKQ36_13715 [Ktedonobacterales bacterium]|nr:hypothetical protein [Ktedonobacterales bacterium]
MDKRSDESPDERTQPNEESQRELGEHVEHVELTEQASQREGQGNDERIEEPAHDGEALAAPSVTARLTEAASERAARTGTLVLTLTLVSALLVSGLLLALSNVTRLHEGSALGQVTPAATPSPTATGLPTPTTEPGFHLYTDRADGFLIQYPAGWTLFSQPPTVQFNDHADSYQLQVSLPDPSITQGVNGVKAQSEFLINFEFDALAQRYVLTRQLGCPAPYTPPIKIGGATWECGIGYISLVGATPTPTLSPTSAPALTPTTSGATPNPTVTATSIACASSSCTQVIVLVTVHDGRPYIINLLTLSDLFEAGNIEYFQPMLNSFAFLPPTQ